MSSLYKRRSSDPAVTLVKMTNAGWSEPIRLAACDRDVESGGELYRAAWFNAEMVNDDGQTPRATLEIPNVDRDIGDVAAALVSPVDVTLAVVPLSDPDHREYYAPGLKLRGCDITEVSVTGEVSGTDYGKEPLGTIRVTPDRFPAIFRL